MRTSRKPLPTLTQLANLTVMQLSNWRWSWRGIITTGIAAPLLFVVTLGFFARDSGPEALSYVLIGNVVLVLMFTLMNRVTSNFSFLRATGALDYFASLPIHKHNWRRLALISAYAPALWKTPTASPRWSPWSCWAWGRCSSPPSAYPTS